MKVALITTTINIPTVLALYRRLDPTVRFFVAMDEKTPKDAYDFCASIPDCEVYSPARQKELGWECSPLLGWNTKARRNIATLEALKWGADLLILLDDDNIPIDRRYFDCFNELFLAPTWCGLRVADIGWFDPGQLQFTAHGYTVCQRGFPQGTWVLQRSPASPALFGPITDARIGVAQATVLGDPDTSAVDRISQHPHVHQVSEVLRAGVVTDPRQVMTVFNSQATAFIRELAPCMLLPTVQWQRYDDIFASLIAQRVMRERGLHVHFGKPFVWQQRNPHDDLRDLRAEIDGMEHILDLAQRLDRLTFGPSETSFQMARAIWDDTELSELGETWVTDCEKAMA